jgi:hypothetical protein
MPDDDQTRILRDRPSPASPPPGPRSDEAGPLGEATRVLTAREAGLLADKPADKIEFKCPNGHRIVVGSQFAGKRGKCSKCGVDVQIPGAETAGSASPAAPGPDEPPTEADEPAPNTPDAATETPPDEAPSPPIDRDEQAASAAGTDSADEPPADWGFVADGVEEGSAVSPQEGDLPALDSGGLFDEEGANPTAYLVARLWAERQHGGVIELHLAGGSVILPSYFDPAWSRGTHGLFGKEELDGSYTLTAVAWGTVEKVIVRQLMAVPPDMFP